MVPLAYDIMCFMPTTLHFNFHIRYSMYILNVS